MDCPKSIRPQLPLGMSCSNASNTTTVHERRSGMLLWWKKRDLVSQIDFWLFLLVLLSVFSFPFSVLAAHGSQRVAVVFPSHQAVHFCLFGDRYCVCALFAEPPLCCVLVVLSVDQFVFTFG